MSAEATANVATRPRQSDEPVPGRLGMVVGLSLMATTIPIPYYLQRRLDAAFDEVVAGMPEPVK